MKFIFNKIFLEHDTGNHPENRKRLEVLGKLQETKIEDGGKYLELYHTKEYIQKVKEACINGGYLDPDTVVTEKSYEAAVAAVGASIMASRTSDFALMRPPGHHAHPSYSSGFCLFNNIAIAVQNLVNKGKKVFIFDFDGHLGDGTEEFFYSTNKVLYWSLHQSPAFPGGGTVQEIGKSKGKGYTINIPLLPNSGDDVYLQAVETFLPIALQFQPDIVAVSAGFDAYKDELLLNLKLSLNTYYRLGIILRRNFNNIFAVLEGGYNLETFPRCLFNFLDGINREEQRFKENQTTSPKYVINEYKKQVKQLKRNLSSYWRL